MANKKKTKKRLSRKYIRWVNNNASASVRPLATSGNPITITHAT